MNKEVAISLMKLALSLGTPINDMLDLVEDISNEEIKIKCKEMVQYLMGHATDIILLIEKIYPELNPDLNEK